MIMGGIINDTAGRSCWFFRLSLEIKKFMQKTTSTRHIISSQWHHRGYLSLVFEATLLTKSPPTVTVSTTTKMMVRMS